MNVCFKPDDVARELPTCHTTKSYCVNLTVLGPFLCIFLTQTTDVGFCNNKKIQIRYGGRRCNSTGSRSRRVILGEDCLTIGRRTSFCFKCRMAIVGREALLYVPRSSQRLLYSLMRKMHRCKILTEKMLYRTSSSGFFGRIFQACEHVREGLEFCGRVNSWRQGRPLSRAVVTSILQKFGDTFYSIDQGNAPGRRWI